MAHIDAKDVMCPDCKRRGMDTKLVIKWSKKDPSWSGWWACPLYPNCCYTEPITGQKITNRYLDIDEKDRQILAGTYKGHMDMEDLYFKKFGKKV
jgi:hypothetical protein